ncbi:MAG: acyl-CoA reductase [Myxococcota bacterium]|nr:acyl-CoA reductase [Myxococcota bacterium]
MADLSPTLARLAALDPADWNTGLSPQAARLAWQEELERIQAGLPELETAPADSRLWIWCAANVFTAPLRFALLAQARGMEVVFKAPSARPEAVLAMANALGCRVETDSQRALAELNSVSSPGRDRVLAFGGDEAMRVVDQSLPVGTPRSLHGHRVSFAVVRGADEDTAMALAWDACLFDGQGCMSPAGVFCLGDAPLLAERIAAAMETLAQRIPRGPVDPGIGPAWRRRTGLARILGQCWEGPEWAVTLLPLDRAEALVLPRMLPVHPLRSLDELEPLSELPLSTLATDLEPLALGFTRTVAPGQMQRPEMSAVHEGVDVVEKLMR